MEKVLLKRKITHLFWLYKNNEGEISYYEYLPSL